jgi:hypothetical protein
MTRHAGSCQLVCCFLSFEMLLYWQQS